MTVTLADWPTIVFQHSIILLGTGANFSLAVLDNLLMHGLKPLALALPEFAPSVLKGRGEIKVDTMNGENCFIARARHLSVQLIYLPETSQSSRTEEISSYNADFLLVACWPYLLSPNIIKAVNKAALNLHPSILPNYRGIDPIAEQIRRQEKKLGVSLHLLNQEFDQGDIIAQASLDTGTESPDRELIEAQAARVGIHLFTKAINGYGSPTWRPRPQ